MRKIILASKSKPRRKLLKQIGLKFTTDTSSVKENHILKGNCAKLVVENAVKKAKDVSSRYKTGIIIAADTVVLVGRKIIGKPAGMDDAFKTLKLISQKPQWVYTGIAVMDIDAGKIYTDYEKTKVYMYRLSDSQIKNYLKNIDVMEKAGSFDVQGLGGIFIDRIEGCFYNVAGMPVAKLARILEKTGVSIL